MQEYRFSTSIFGYTAAILNFEQNITRQKLIIKILLNIVMYHIKKTEIMSTKQ